MSKFSQPFIELRAYLPLTNDPEALRALNLAFGEWPGLKKFLKLSIQDKPSGKVQEVRPNGRK